MHFCFPARISFLAQFVSSCVYPPPPPPVERSLLSYPSTWTSNRVLSCIARLVNPRVPWLDSEVWSTPSEDRRRCIIGRYIGLQIRASSLISFNVWFQGSYLRPRLSTPWITGGIHLLKASPPKKCIAADIMLLLVYVHIDHVNICNIAMTDFPLI